MFKNICPCCGSELEKLQNGRYYCDTCEDTFEEKDILWRDEDDDQDDEELIPDGCLACGGPYPNCKTSCKIFDD